MWWLLNLTFKHFYNDTPVSYQCSERLELGIVISACNFANSINLINNMWCCIHIVNGCDSGAILAYFVHYLLCLTFLWIECRCRGGISIIFLRYYFSCQRFVSQDTHEPPLQLEAAELSTQVQRSGNVRSQLPPPPIPLPVHRVIGTQSIKRW